MTLVICFLILSLRLIVLLWALLVTTVHLFSCLKESKIRSKGLQSFVHIYVVILSFVLVWKFQFLKTINYNIKGPYDWARASIVQKLLIMKFVIFWLNCYFSIFSRGDDFRKDYSRLAMLCATFPSVPVVALTATASRSDVTFMLKPP